MRIIVLMLAFAALGSTATAGPMPGSARDRVGSPPVARGAGVSRLSIPVHDVPTDEVRWTRIGRVPIGGDAAGGGPFAVVGFERGYVVLDGSRKVRFSPDGVAWTTVLLAHGSGTPLDVNVAASSKGRVVVGGSYTPCSKSAWSANPWGSCRARPASWISKDGLHWHASRNWTGRIGPVGKAGSAFISIWRIPGGGWDAAQLFSGSDESDDLDPTGPALWHSVGGRKWTLVRRGPPEPGASCDGWSPGYLTGFGGGGGIRAIPYSCESGVIVKTSSDGRTYRRASGLPQVEGQWVSDALGSRGARPWVFVGDYEIAPGERQVIAWSTPDLASWTVTSLPVPDGLTWAHAGSASRWRGGFVAAGYGTNLVDNVLTLTWLSDDGEAWRLASQQAHPGVAVEQMASGPAGTLGFGTVPANGHRYRMPVWRLDPAP